jgi:ABC-type Zn uptake system ZnuABC Zn-binding protein ZnuA
MIKTNKTNLQFFLGAILFVSFTVAACNNDGEKKETVKDEPATTTTTTTVVRDSTDTMVKEKVGVSPTPGGGN